MTAVVVDEHRIVAAGALGGLVQVQKDKKSARFVTNVWAQLPFKVQVTSLHPAYRQDTLFLEALEILRFRMSSSSSAAQSEWETAWERIDQAHQRALKEETERSLREETEREAREARAREREREEREEREERARREAERERERREEMERQKEARLRRERERREKMDREREARATARQAREAARAEERRRERDTQQRERVFRERGALREKALNTRPMPKADLLSMLGYAFLPPGLDRGSLSTSLTTSLASSRPKRGPNISDITRQSGGDSLAAGATASVSICQHPSASVSKSGGDAFASGATAACCAALSPAEAASAEMLPAAAAAAAAAAPTLSLDAAAEV